MLAVNDLYKSYRVGKTSFPVLKGVSLTVNAGEFVAVMGPSGSGKTTLLNWISCYIPADRGNILLDGRELAGLRRRSWPRCATGSWASCFRTFCCWTGSP